MLAGTPAIHRLHNTGHVPEGAARIMFMYGGRIPDGGRTMSRSWLTWALILGGVSVLVVFLTGQLYLGFVIWSWRIGWDEALLWAAPDIYIWLLLIPLIIWISRSLPLERDVWLRHLPIHLVSAVAIALAALWLRFRFEEATVALTAQPWSLGAPKFLNMWFFRLGISVPSGILIYWTTLGVTHALRYYGKFRENQLKAARLEAQLARAELEALEMQLHPHFLFNTLNSVAVLMRRDVDAAGRMLNRLSDLLRLTLERAGEQLIPLKDELEILQGYLRIQQIRFQDRLTVEWSIDPDTLHLKVPNLILQPLVENSIRHAIAPRAERGKIEVEAAQRDGMLLLHVRDDGPGLPQATGYEPGIGLANTRERLQVLYGSAHRFEMRNIEGGLQVTLGIPLGAAEHETADMTMDEDHV